MLETFLASDTCGQQLAPMAWKGQRYCDPRVLGSSLVCTASCWQTWKTPGPSPVCPILHNLRGHGACRDGTQARGASRPSSEFVDGAPRLAAREREVDGSNRFPPITHASSVLAVPVGSKGLYHSQSSLGIGWRTDRGSRTLYRSMAHSSSDGHVGYIVWPRIVSSHKTVGMPSPYSMFPEVAISKRIHLEEKTSTQPCESANASPDRCGPEPCVLVAL